jgi:hypothetical protein
MELEKLKKFGKFCDKIISTKNIKKINKIVSKVEKIFTNQKDNTFFSLYLAYYISQLYSELAILEREKPACWQITDKNFVPSPNMVNALNYIRQAYAITNFIADDIKYPIITQLANYLNEFGRGIEALPLWNVDFGLLRKTNDAPFISAINKAYFIYYFGRFINDTTHQALYVLEANKLIDLVIEYQKYSDHPEVKLINNKQWVINLKNSAEREKERTLPIEQLSYQPSYQSGDEKKYKRWCAENCLYLNNLNDISNLPIVEQDILQFPDYADTVDKDEPVLSAAFSAIKRDYITARVLLYEGYHRYNCPGYMDDALFLTDLEEGLQYDLAIEKVRLSFRTVFGTLDSLYALMINYFNNYPKNIKSDFNGSKIRTQLSQHENHFLKSLYWIACDLYQGSKDDDAVPNPDADKITTIRNELEHGWLRIVSDQEVDPKIYPYGVTIKRSEFIQLTIKILQLARACMIYFTAAVISSENKKANNGIVISKPIASWEN